MSATLDGIRRAGENAGTAWRESAGAALAQYIAAHPTAVFIAPEVREWAHSNGLPLPPTAMAWGSVFQHASRAGDIRRVGYTQYGKGAMHMQSVAQWTAA